MREGEGAHERPAASLVERWKKTCRALFGPLRVAYLRSETALHPLPLLAEAVDLVCSSAEQAEPDARELLVGLVDLLAGKEQIDFAQALREEAAGRPLLSLARLLRRPGPSSSPAASAAAAGAARHVPDYGAGRPLTLGERKALARRPTRKALDKLLGDPHPAVIRTLLGNPKLTEDDVVRVAARRPGNAEVLAEIARSEWSHRLRVRRTLVLNPDSPAELAIPLLALLLRPELRQVAEATYLPPPLRVAAHELLERRPPVRRRPATLKLQ